MRLFTSILITVAFMAAGAANAVTFSASASATEIGLGEQVTIDVTVVLDAGDSLNALGSDVYNYDPALAFVNGQGVGEVFFQTGPAPPAIPPTNPFCQADPTNALCQPSPPADGLGTGTGPDLAETPAAAGTGFGGRPRVNLTSAIDLFNQYTPQGFDDPGLDGAPGSAQFTLVFEGADVGTVDVIIGGGVDLNGVAGGSSDPSINNATLSITVIPEPGTALLMGIGLAGLALAGRRE